MALVLNLLVLEAAGRVDAEGVEGPGHHRRHLQQQHYEPAVADYRGRAADLQKGLIT